MKEITYDTSAKMLQGFPALRKPGFYYLAEAEYDGPLGALPERYFQ